MQPWSYVLCVSGVLNLYSIYNAIYHSLLDIIMYDE